MHSTFDPVAEKNVYCLLVYHAYMQRKESHIMNRTKGRIELEGRVASFGLATLKMLREVPLGLEFKNIRSRLAQSATNAGLIYRMTNLADSHVEHARGLAAALKAMAENEYWLGLLEELNPRLPGVAQLHREAADILNTFSLLQRKAERQKEQKSEVHPQ